MTKLSVATLKELMVRTRARYREIDHADWDGLRYRTGDQTKWEQAASEIAPADWVEVVRILAHGWDYYGGSNLPGEEGRR
jgi:hypothetical protein